MAIKLKYFVLKPASKFKGDPFAAASRKAMRAYANHIHKVDQGLADSLIKWASVESDIDAILKKDSGHLCQCRLAIRRHRGRKTEGEGGWI